MNKRASEVTEVTKAQLVEEFSGVVADTEQLLKSVATAGGEKADAMRAGAEKNLAKAKDMLRDFQQAAADKTRATAKSADAYVHDNPWQAIGVVAGVAVVLGALLSRR